MRMDRMSPRSSVTGQALLTNVRLVSKWWFWLRRAEHALPEPIGGFRRAGGGRRPGPAADALEAGPDGGRPLVVELGQDVADDPGAVAVTCLGGPHGFQFTERRDGRPIDQD